MLVLARRKTESITFKVRDPRNPEVVIAEATVTLLEIQDGRVRLGVDADDCIRVLRSELEPIVSREPEFQLA